MAKRAPRCPPGPAYWLIVKNANGRIEVLTLGRDDTEMLPVFSFEEEAAMFLRLRGVGEEWRVKEGGAGELISVLLGPCAGIKEVTLDPLPEMVAERTVGLVSLLRESFLECSIATRDFSALRAGQWIVATRGEQSRRSEADRAATPEAMMHSKEEGMPGRRRECLYRFVLRTLLISNLGGVILPNTPQGASHNLGKS
jgi:hypothetical protein